MDIQVDMVNTGKTDARPGSRESTAPVLLDHEVDIPESVEAVTLTQMPDLSGLPTVMKIIFRVARRIRWGSIIMIVPDGRAFHFQGREEGPEAVFKLNDYSVFRKLWRHGTLGFGEAYFQGLWESPDVTTLLEILARNEDDFEEFFTAGKLFQPFQQIFNWLRRNNKQGSRRNIIAHYDLGNDFYGQWLDPSMTYSSAKFIKGTEDLSEAQRNKYKSLADELKLEPHHTLLEIGSGWGGFAEYAATEIGCKITGITISPEQYKFSVERIKRQGLEDRVEFRLQDYRDVDGKFDRIASIEMLEAVGLSYWPVYFRTLFDRLEPGGLAGVQVITIEDKFFDGYSKRADFIQRYIFPGGMLPSPNVLKNQVGNAGLIWRNNVNFGLDYAKTLSEWRNRFQSAWPEIQTLGFDERFRLLWKYYLSYCEAGFRVGCIDVAQFTVQRPQEQPQSL